MNAPVIQSATSVVSSGIATSLVFNKPASTSTGDLLVVEVQADTDALGRSWTSPAGWTDLFDSEDSGAAGSSRTRCSYRVADGTEGGTFTWLYGPTGRNLCGIIRRITGQAASSFITATLDATQVGFHSTATSPSATCPANHCLVLWGGSLDNARSISSVAGSALTVNQDVVGGINNNSSALLAVGNSTDSGTGANTGTATWTFSSGVSLFWLGYTIIIVPKAGGLLMARRRRALD